VNIDDILFLASIWVIPVLLAITLHEAAHGWAASKLGDDTAKNLGRVTFNPLAHIDPFGTIILPAILISAGGILFGWAKPVPVNFGRLGRPRRDMVLVAAAGPAVNIGLAIVSALALHLLPCMKIRKVLSGNIFLKIAARSLPLAGTTASASASPR